MLDNRHVQYRFLNARAEAVAKAKAAAAVVSFLKNCDKANTPSRM
jgi:hypothetical protein